MGVTETFSILLGLPREQRLLYAEAALREPYVELQAAAFRALTDPRALNRPDLIIQHYPDLLPEVKARVAEQKWVFVNVAKDIIRAGVDRVRRSAYEMLAAIEEMEVAPTLLQGLGDASALIRETAVEALEKLALRYRYHLQNFRAEGEAQSKKFVEDYRSLMVQSLETLLRSYGVHRKNVFLSIAIDFGEDAYNMITGIVLARRDSPIYKAFQQVMATTQSEQSFDLLFRLSFESEPLLRDAAVEVMDLRRTPAFANAIAAYFVRMTPDRLAALASRVKEVPWWPAVEAAPDLEPQACAKIIDFISKTNLDPVRRAACLLFFLSSGHSDVRVRALLTLQSVKFSKLIDVAARALNDPADMVKIAAAHIIVDLNPPNKVRLLAPLVNATSPEVRRLAVREVAKVSFSKYLQSFSKLDPKTREAAAKALAKIDDGMLDRVTEEVSSLDPLRRIKALQVIEYIDAEKDLRETLMELLADPDKRVRATVIKIVELSGSVEGMKILIAALSDPDRRVRANAIEAFEEIGDTRYVQLLTPFLGDRDNRLRANAAKALWNLGYRNAREVLEVMLVDADENMRLSAVWAMGELRYEGAAAALAARLTQEPGEKVKAKIVEVLSRLTEKNDV